MPSKKHRNPSQYAVKALISVFASVTFIYFGPLAPQMNDWFGASKIHLVVIILLAAASRHSLSSKLVFSALLGLSSLLLTTAVGDNGTLVDGGQCGDWLLYQILTVYAQYVEGLVPLYVGCLVTMFISALFFLGGK